MNFTRMVLALGLSVFSLSCTGWDDEPIRGELKLSEQVHFKGNDGRSVTLIQGPATLEFENGLYGVYSPAASLVDAHGQRVELTLSRGNFSGLTFEASPEELGQPYGVRATRQQTILSREPFIHVQSCRYCGYCYINERIVKHDGTIDRQSGFQHSCRCRGQEELTKERRTISESLTVEFTRARGAEAIGSFTSSESKVFLDESTVLERTSCSASLSDTLPTVRLGQ
jgi:hypothetical protein